MSTDDPQPDDPRVNEPNNEHSKVDVDAAWAEIVARWDSVAEPRPGVEEPATEADTGEAVDLRAREEAATDRVRGERVAGELSWDTLFDGDLFDNGTEAGTDSETTSGTNPQRAPESVEPAPQPSRPPGKAINRPLGTRDIDPLGPSLLDGLDGHGEPEADHYIPPEPPPLPRPELVSGLAWLGAIGAPILLLVIALFWRDAPAYVIGLAVVGFVAGFITLVMRLPDQHEEDDDGAVV